MPVPGKSIAGDAAQQFEKLGRDVAGDVAKTIIETPVDVLNQVMGAKPKNATPTEEPAPEEKPSRKKSTAGSDLAKVTEQLRSERIRKLREDIAQYQEEQLKSKTSPTSATSETIGPVSKATGLTAQQKLEQKTRKAELKGGN
jgi:hypothetical protein